MLFDGMWKAGIYDLTQGSSLEISFLILASHLPHERVTFLSKVAAHHPGSVPLGVVAKTKEERAFLKMPVAGKRSFVIDLFHGFLADFMKCQVLLMMLDVLFLSEVICMNNI